MPVALAVTVTAWAVAKSAGVKARLVGEAVSPVLPLAVDGDGDVGGGRLRQGEGERAGLALGDVQAGRGRGDGAGGRRGGGPGGGAGDRGGRGVGAGVVEVGPGRGGGAGGQAAVVGRAGHGDRLAGLGPVAVPAVGQGLAAGVGVGHRPAGDGRGAVVGDGQVRGEAAAPVVRHAVGGGARRGGRHRRDRPRAAGHGQAERGQQGRPRHSDRPAQPPHGGSRSWNHVSTPPGVMAPLTTAVSAVGLTAVTIGLSWQGVQATCWPCRCCPYQPAESRLGGRKLHGGLGSPDPE